MTPVSIWKVSPTVSILKFSPKGFHLKVMSLSGKGKPRTMTPISFYILKQNVQYCKCCNCEKESEASYEFLYFLFPQRLITGQLHWFVCFFCLCLCLLYCGEESESVMNFSAVCSLICFHRLVRPEIAAVWRLTLPLTWNYTKSCQLWAPHKNHFPAMASKQTWTLDKLFMLSQVMARWVFAPWGFENTNTFSSFSTFV